MPAPRLERIRPCVHCGALMPFSALRCGACGTAAAGAALGDERVRPCLQCGVILRFDQDPCPQCGARAREEAHEDRVKPCAQCGAILPFEQLYCASCGELSIAIQTDDIPPQVELAEPDGGAATKLPVAIGSAAILVGLGSLAAALVEILR
jgi:RNA polymerase subunit RPABC4/transcription elongation factor Spt4